ncbi:hypothetical protein ACH5RR_038941 [Cinchona calisaya]|uniref:Fe2OG dioxygenase domain-containing protein n=1 Tax=Cinchona calisaya TaxID=153742 RepID=A0ABD2Y2D2_9GENT
METLPVDNVQDFTSLKDISQQYISPEIMPGDQVSIHESFEIPVIDMGKLTTDHVGYQNEMAKLYQASKEWGFFQLINHGATTAIEKMKVVVEDFFKLPLEQKMVYAHQPNGVEGYGHVFAAPSKILQWGDMLFLTSLPVSQRNLSLWPSTPATFRSTCDEYSLEMDKISKGLIRVMATTLGVNPEILSSMYEDGTQAIRMNYYPPANENEKVTHPKAHRDTTGITLLVQINEVNGLEIKKDNEWVLVKPIPGAIIINIGDIMEVMSNGEYSSIEHRTIVNFQKQRLSIAAFHSPNLSTKIGPLPNLSTKNGAKFKTIEREEYTRMLLTRKIGDEDILDQVKINQ